MMSQDDPFASVRLNRRDQKPVLEVSEKTKNNEDPFESVKIKEAKGFPGIKEIGRHAARLGSRIAETIGGIPGDTQSLIDSGLFAGYEAITGKKTPEELKTRKFPTSGEIKQKAEERLGEFIKPQSSTEKTIDEYAEKVASLVGPMKFRKALGVALGSQLAKKGIKTLGFGESAQEAGSLGTMFLLSAMNPRGAMNYASSQFKKADSLAKGASIQANKFEDNLTKLVQDLNKGVTTSSKNAVLRPAEDLLKKINNGKIAVQDLTAAKRDINTLMGEPETLSGAKKLLKSLGKEVDNALKPFEKINPEFSKAYRPANEIYGAVMEGNKAYKFLTKTLGAKSIVGATIAEIALGHPEAILPTMGAAGVAIGIAKTSDFLTRLAKSPELRKYYHKVLLFAAKEDAGAVRTYADKIEKILEKDQTSSSSQAKGSRSIQ